jgi:hypothetical protein
MWEFFRAHRLPTRDNSSNQAGKQPWPTD